MEQLASFSLHSPCSSAIVFDLSCVFLLFILFSSFFFIDPAPTQIYTLSLHDALPISGEARRRARVPPGAARLARPPDIARAISRSEEHTSELQSRVDLVCRLLLEKKKIRR